MEGKKIVAVFDWDNTVRNGYTIRDWLVHLLDIGHEVQPLISVFDSYAQAYADNEISHDDFAMKFCIDYCVFFKGWDESLLLEEVDSYIFKDKQSLFGFSADLFRHFKQQNIPIIVLTGAPSLILNKYKKIFGIDAVLGFEHEVEAGKFTGRVESNFGYEKGKTMKVVRAIYMGKIVGFGDSESDLPIINNSDIAFVIGNENLHHNKRMGSVFCINPDENFLKIKSLLAIKPSYP